MLYVNLYQHNTNCTIIHLIRVGTQLVFYVNESMLIMLCKSHNDTASGNAHFFKNKSNKKCTWPTPVYVVIMVIRARVKRSQTSAAPSLRLPTDD